MGELDVGEGMCISKSVDFAELDWTLPIVKARPSGVH